MSVRAAVWTVWWLVVAGVAAGLVWLLVAPRAKIRIDADGSGYFVDPSPREYIHADLAYTAICLVVAVGAAVLVRRFVRAHPVSAVAGLAVGGLAAAVTAWLVGRSFGPLDLAAARRAKAGTIVLDKLDLGTKGLVLALPVGALATWLIVDLVTQRRSGTSVSDGIVPPEPELAPELSPDVRPEPPAPPSARPGQ